MPPIYRMLKCTECKSTAVRIENINYEFRFNDLSFHAKCPHCHRVTRHMVHDYADPNPDRIRIKSWDPKRMTDAGRRNMWVDEGQRDTIRKLANMVAERDKEIARLNQLLYGISTTPP